MGKLVVAAMKRKAKFEYIVAREDLSHRKNCGFSLRDRTGAHWSKHYAAEAGQRGVNGRGGSETDTNIPLPPFSLLLLPILFLFFLLSSSLFVTPLSSLSLPATYI